MASDTTALKSDLHNMRAGRAAQGACHVRELLRRLTEGDRQLSDGYLLRPSVYAFPDLRSSRRHQAAGITQQHGFPRLLWPSLAGVAAMLRAQPHYACHERTALPLLLPQHLAVGSRPEQPLRSVLALHARTSGHVCVE